MALVGSMRPIGSRSAGPVSGVPVGPQISEWQT
jgi:hypothetical protein